MKEINIVIIFFDNASAIKLLFVVTIQRVVFEEILPCLSNSLWLLMRSSHTSCTIKFTHMKLLLRNYATLSGNYFFYNDEAFEDSPEKKR